ARSSARRRHRSGPRSSYEPPRSIGPGRLRIHPAAGPPVPTLTRDVISTNQFKNGTHIEVDGTVFKIVEFQHVKPGKGGAFVRTKLKALESGGVVDKTFRAGEKMPRIHTEVSNVTYLYNDGSDVVLMDAETFEQIQLPADSLTGELRFMKENDTVQLLLVDGKPSSLQLPASVEL